MHKKSNGMNFLNQEITAILAATFRAVSLRLRITDKFENIEVAECLPGKKEPIYTSFA